MRFTIRPFRRFPVQFSVTYNARPFISHQAAVDLLSWF